MPTAIWTAARGVPRLVGTYDRQNAAVLDMTSRGSADVLAMRLQLLGTNAIVVTMLPLRAKLKH